MTIQTDPSRCWVRIDTRDAFGTAERTLIGDAWALEPWGPPGLADEFSLTIAAKVGDRRRVHAGLRLNREEGTAVRDALTRWLTRGEDGPS